MDFDTEIEFPADDTGHGFDNIGEVLALPPMLLEKCLLAANRVMTTAVPSTSKTVSEHVIAGGQFHGSKDTSGKERPARNRNEGSLSLSFYLPAAVSNTFRAEHEGKYRLGVDLMVNEKYVDNVFDYNKCRVVFKVDGKEARRQEFSWEGGKLYHYDLDQDWKRGRSENGGLSWNRFDTRRKTNPNALGANPDRVIMPRTDGAKILDPAT